MAWKNLEHFISFLENENELIRVKELVSPELQISEIADRFSKNNGKALLFENNGTDFPVLINLFGSEKRILAALGMESFDEGSERINDLFNSLMQPSPGFGTKIRQLGQLKELAGWFPKKKKGRGACQEVIMEKPDMRKLPVLSCWPADGGPFVTLPMVHTLDPETGKPNLGMYRMQVFGPGETGMHWHLHKDSARHFRKYKENGERMPVSVAVGGDPVYTYCATAPLPPDIDEYILAGFLRKKRVELVKSITNDIYVPADADFIIEGYIDPEEELAWEGPFGDHTGFYSLADYYPRFHITCITHRKRAVYPATIVGIPPMEDGWMGKATEEIFKEPIKKTMLPELVDFSMPVEGCFHNLVLLSLENNFPGHISKSLHALWGAGQMAFSKVMVAFDENSELDKKDELLSAFFSNVDPGRDIFFTSGPADVLEHASPEFALGGKMGINASQKKEETIDEPVFKPREVSDLFNESYVDTRWLDRGLPFIVVYCKDGLSGDLKRIQGKMIETGAIQNVPFVLYLDEGFVFEEGSDLLWWLLANFDPRADVFLDSSEWGRYTACMGIDLRRKSKGKHNFQRDWPNPVVSDAETIKWVDENWKKLELGSFMNSPSNLYSALSYGDGAIALKNK